MVRITLTSLGLALLLGAEVVRAEPVLVRAQTLGALRVPITHSAPAEVLSLNDTDISAEITARIVAIPVQVGVTVDAGEVLMELDCRDYALRARRAEADLLAARAHESLASQQLQRAETLAREQHMSADVLDQRRSELEAAAAVTAARQVDTDVARTNVERCVLRSPFRAVVVERVAGLGELANPGSPLLRVKDLDAVEVSAQIIPTDAGGLRQGRSITLHHLGRDYPLRLERVVPTIDTHTRTLEARLRFTGEAALIGASGRLRWESPRQGIPSSLIVRRGERLGVFTLREGNAVFVAVPGALEGRPAEVDLPATTLIITEGRFAVRDGDPVVRSE